MKDYTQKHSKETYSDIWLTPKWLFDKLNKEFKFDLDPATEQNNPLGTQHFFTEQDNSLTKEWNGNVFINPPYSNIETWIKKSLDEWNRDRYRDIVMLIPARTDTKYFHNLIVPHCEVRFIKGRLKFSEKGSAPFPSMVVIFNRGGNSQNIISIEKEVE